MYNERTLKIATLLVFACLSVVVFCNSQPGVLKRVPPIQVLVTGVSLNGVGFHVFAKLLKRKQHFSPVALVDSQRTAEKLIQVLDALPENFKVGDITKKDSLSEVFQGCKRAILCTSAKPEKTLGRKLKDFIRRVFRREAVTKATSMYYPEGQDPYLVDYIGQKNVIDLAVEAQVSHVVMLGSMGGYTGSKLNDIGRNIGEKDPKKGNILKWKRAAERYLMKRAFFTIVHAGTLTDEPGGLREIVWDVDDSLLRTNFRKIPQEDCAEVLVQALLHKESIGRSIDIASRLPGQGTGPTKDWTRFWSIPGSNTYPADLD